MEVDPVRNWLEDGGLSRAVPLYEEKLFREIYVYFRQDMEEVGIKHIPGTNRFNAQVRAFIADEGDDIANLDSMMGNVKDMLSFFKA